MKINQPKSVSARLQELYLRKLIGHPFATFAILHAVIILGLFTILNYQLYIDPGGLERWFALTILNGHYLPYHDFVTEYPPLAILTFVLPGLIFREPLSYSLGFAFEIFIADIVILVFLLKLSDKLKINMFKIGGAYSILLLSLGSLITLRHDMVPAMLTVIIIYGFISGKNRTVWILLGLGIMTKIYPAVLAPLLGIFYLLNKQYNILAKGIFLMMAVILIIALPWLIIDSHGFLYFLSYHADRGLQSESSYATILLVGQVLGLDTVNGVFNYSSWNLSSSLADKMAELSTYIMIGVLTIVFLVFGWKLKRLIQYKIVPHILDSGSVWLFLRFSALAVLALILTDKVLSPQYLIWVCPLLVMVNVKPRYLLWALFIIAGIFTQYVYPFNYSAYEMGEAAPVIVEALRNLLLLAMALIIAFSGGHIRSGTLPAGETSLIK